MENRPSWIVVHHTGVSRGQKPDQFVETDKYHKSLDFPKSSMGFYNGYHFEISADGTVKQARSEWEEGAHTKGMNFSSIGIALDGNFDIEYPTQSQLDALIPLLRRFQARYNIPSSKIVPHRTFKNKSCYGNLLADSWARDILQGSLVKDSWVRALLTALVRARVIIEPQINLIFGGKSANELEAPCE